MASKRRRSSSPRRSTSRAAAPATRRRRKRVSRPVDWTVWLWVLVGANWVGGLYLSPITAPIKVSLLNVRSSDQEYFQKVLDEYRETPMVRLNRAEIESKLLKVDALKSVSFDPNVFGRATVTAIYRKPVARISNAGAVLIDQDGEVYMGGVEEATLRLPVVTVPASNLDPSGCLTGQWPRRGVTQTVELMKKGLPQLDYSLEIDGKSILSLQVTDGPTVVFGTAEKLDEKVKKLAEIYANPGVKLNKGSVVNLVAPDFPTIK